MAQIMVTTQKTTIHNPTLNQQETESKTEDRKTINARVKQDR